MHGDSLVLTVFSGRIDLPTTSGLSPETAPTTAPSSDVQMPNSGPTIPNPTQPTNQQLDMGRQTDMGTQADMDAESVTEIEGRYQV